MCLGYTISRVFFFKEIFVFMYEEFLVIRVFFIIGLFIIFWIVWLMGKRRYELVVIYRRYFVFVIK